MPADDVHVLVRDAIEAWAADPGRPAGRSTRSRRDRSRRAELEARIAEAQDWLADLIDKRAAATSPRPGTPS